jgi:hypothetical protein
MGERARRKFTGGHEGAPAVPRDGDPVIPAGTQQRDAGLTGGGGEPDAWKAHVRF